MVEQHRTQSRVRPGRALLAMRRARPGPLSRRGLTLIEMMVVLAVVGLLLLVGVPNLREMMLRHQLRVTANAMFAAINLTRAQAVARGQRVMMTPADPLRADWASGWLVFVDRNASLGFDAGDELIYQRGPLERGMRVRSTFASPLAPFYIAYNSAGRSCAAGNSMAARPGGVSLALGRGARHIKINMLGRARICDPEKQAHDCEGAAND